MLTRKLNDNTKTQPKLEPVVCDDCCKRGVITRRHINNLITINYDDTYSYRYLCWGDRWYKQGRHDNLSDFLY